jgi:D-threo-aldose 1-dehydrogenase
MNPFESVEIGRTGVQVTRLGLGGAPLSGMTLADGIYRGSSFETGVSIIRKAYDLGIRYFDTAPLYGSGRSEVRYGRVLSDWPRDSFALSTKVSRRLVLERPDDLEPYSEDGIPEYKCVFDFSGEGIEQTLASSLQRLRLEAVDILYLHDSDFVGEHSDDQFAQGLEALVELRERGVVKAIGMGMNQWEVTARMVERFDLDLILLAGRYTLLDQSALPRFMPLCLERGVRLAIGGPYNSGILATDLDQPASFEYAPAGPELVARAKRIKAVCDRHQVDLKAAALQFVLAHPAVATAVPGAATVAELVENARVVQQEIPAALWDELKSRQLLPAEAPTPG